MNQKRTMVFTLRGLINSGLVDPKHVCVRVDFGDAWLQELSTHKNYYDYLDYEVLGIESTGNTNQICVRLKGKNYNEEAAANRTKTMTIFDLKVAIKDLPDNMEVFIPLYETNLNSNKFVLKDIGEVKFAGVVNDKTYGKGFSLIIAPDITTLDFDDFYRPNPNVDFVNQLYPTIK